MLIKRLIYIRKKQSLKLITARDKKGTKQNKIFCVPSECVIMKFNYHVIKLNDGRKLNRELIRGEFFVHQTISSDEKRADS